MKIEIQPLAKKDVRKAAAIVGKNHSKKFERLAVPELREMFRKGPIAPYYFVAEQNREIVGVGGYIQSWMDYNIYHISWVNVPPEQRKQGIGTKLISHIIREIKKKRGAEYILITTTLPAYYKKHWGFKTLYSVGEHSEKLMVLAC